MNMLRPVDKALQKVVRYIAFNPGCSGYQIGTRSGIDRIKAMRKISQYKLIEENILRTEKGKRKANLYYLTFKGVLFALNIGSIKPEEAALVRQKHNANPPSCSIPLVDENVIYFFRFLAREVPEELANELGFTLNVPKVWEKIQLIIEKHGSDPLIFRELEIQYSKEIYTYLLKTVNINFYDPSMAAYHYYWIRNSYFFSKIGKWLKIYRTRNNKKIEKAFKEMMRYVQEDPCYKEIMIDVILPMLKENLTNEEKEKISFFENFLKEKKGLLKFTSG